MEQQASSTEVKGGTSEIQVDTFGGAVTFDDLDSVGANETTKTTKIDKALNVPEGEKSSKKAEDGKKDDKEADAKQDKSTDSKLDDKDKKAADDKAAAAAKAKIIKAKNGDVELDIPSEAKVKVKVDGKEEEFTVQELINEFSGKTNYGRKFQELDTQTKAFHAERDELNGSIDTLFKLAVTENKPLEAVQYLSDLLGGDGIKTVMDLQKQMLAQLAEEAKLSPEQLDAKQAKQRADLLQAKFDNQKKTDAKKAEMSEVAKRVEAVKTKHNIDDTKFNEVYKTLKEAGVKSEELTPEFVGEIHERWSRMDEVDSIAKELEITDQVTIKKLYREYLAKDESGKPLLSQKELRSIVEQVFGGKKKSNLKDKIDRNNGGDSKQVSKKQHSSNEATFFDDLN